MVDQQIEQDEHEPPMCVICKHRTIGVACEAFPDGIPQDIYVGSFDHRLPHKGDGGITFEPASKYGPPLVKEVLTRYE